MYATFSSRKTEDSEIKFSCTHVFLFVRATMCIGWALRNLQPALFLLSTEAQRESSFSLEPGHKMAHIYRIFLKLVLFYEATAFSTLSGFAPHHLGGGSSAHLVRKSLSSRRGPLVSTQRRGLEQHDSCDVEYKHVCTLLFLIDWPLWHRYSEYARGRRRRSDAFRKAQVPLNGTNLNISFYIRRAQCRGLSYPLLTRLGTWMQIARCMLLPGALAGRSLGDRR